MFRLSCDDGCASDVRVAELAKKYNVECTFYWPVEWHSLAYDNGYEPLEWYDALSISLFHEIGSHTITHRHLTKMTWGEATPEITDSQEMLSRLFNQPIRKFCPPRGYLNDELIDVVNTYYDSYRLTKGKGLVHVHPNSGANNNLDWRDYAKSIEVEELWFHSWELDKYDLWQQLEDYLKANA